MFFHFFDHIQDMLELRPVSQSIGYDFPVVQIQDRRQIEFLVFNLELGDISDPLLFGLICFEVSLEDIRRYFTLFSPVGNVLFGSYQAFKSKFPHQAENGFVIDRIASVLEFQMDSSVAISAFVKLIDLLDFLFDRPVLILIAELVEMIVEGASCHPSMLEKLGQCMLLP